MKSVPFLISDTVLFAFVGLSLIISWAGGKTREDRKGTTSYLVFAVGALFWSAGNGLLLMNDVRIGEVFKDIGAIFFIVQLPVMFWQRSQRTTPAGKN